MIPYSRMISSQLSRVEINDAYGQFGNTEAQTAAEFFSTHHGTDLQSALTAAIEACDSTHTTDVAIGLIWKDETPSPAMIELLEDADFQPQSEHDPFYSYINRPEAAWLDSQLLQYLHDQTEQHQDNDACCLWFYRKNTPQDAPEFGILLMAEHPRHGRAETVLAALQQVLGDYFAPAYFSSYRL